MVASAHRCDDLRAALVTVLTRERVCRDTRAAGEGRVARDLQLAARPCTIGVA